MENLATVLEQELEEAFEVKNPKSLRRYVLLLADRLVHRDTYDRDVGEIKSDIRIIAESMKQGFENMNVRFDDMNRRFEDMNHRFDDMNHRFDDTGKRTTTMFTLMNIILGVLVLITVLFKFI